MKKIAWIGTGVMGRPMAEHVRRAGYDVVVYNRSPEKAIAMAPFVKVAATISECVKDADVIFSIVGYPSDVRAVYDTVFACAKQGAICVDMTTSSPALAKSLYQEAKLKGLKMIDSPVTGGDIGAINATLSIMVGGDEADFLEILPLLEIMGKKITYMGVAGNGQHAKLANQIVIAGNVAGIAEALVYAKAKGLDPNRVLAVVTGGSAASWQAEKNGAKMIVKDYRPGFFIKHYLKDLNLVLTEKGNLELEVVERVAHIYQVLSDAGRQDQGTQAILEYYLAKWEAASIQ
jgi:3-hydroxyisobutyrate dehydrogenase